MQVIYKGFFGIITAESGLVSNLVPNYFSLFTNIYNYFLYVRVATFYYFCFGIKKKNS
jgi:hypothetical protein